MFLIMLLFYVVLVLNMFFVGVMSDAVCSGVCTVEAPPAGGLLPITGINAQLLFD